jgi:hypothetical protein
VIQLAVTYANGQTMYHPVPEGQGWKIDTMQRVVVIGKGVPRTIVPLDGVLHFELLPLPVPPTAEDAT